MSGYDFPMGTSILTALPSGALWWSAQEVLCISDLHLGKAERIARLGGTLLPPYDNAETLDRLRREISEHAPRTVICLGDSFDDVQASSEIDDGVLMDLSGMMAGRRWIWIAGNHDPGGLEISGEFRTEIQIDDLVFRHEATAIGKFEISGHYHPKVRVPLGGRSVTRACFLYDVRRLILPAFGAYTGGLSAQSPSLSVLLEPDAVAILTGKRATPVLLSALPR